MAQVIWTESALINLDEIGDYISKDSIRYAELTVNKLFESPNILEANPLAGPVVPELQNESIRQLIRGSFRIIYHVVDEELIEILTVHRSARLFSNTYDFDNLVNE
jgi:addiction module RelE/StbE family toxin